ncbi:MAG: amidase [Geminicoccaceae bacterium]
MNDVTRYDLTTLSAMLARRELSALDLTDACLARIEQWNPVLNAFRHIDVGHARDQANAADARPHRQSPLDGIPIAAKDNIDIEGLVTRSGIGPRAEEPATEDADVIKKLRAAGAIILGHTNMHEGALGATNDNPHDGRTYNPWRIGHTPGGSSGGSAAAVAARLCPLALGTDTMGSIRLPAAYSGVAGYKPGLRQISNLGIEPLCRTLDQVGPIARTVSDLCLGFETITATSPTDEVDLRAQRIARPTFIDEIEIEDEVRKAFEGVLRIIESRESDVSPVVIDGYDPGQTRRAGLLLIEAEAADHFRDDRARFPSSFSDMFATLLDYGAGADGERITKANVLITGVRRAFDAVFEVADLLLMPTAPQTAFSFDHRAPSNQADLTALANFAGAPAISFPIGLDREGLPIGLQVIGARGSDARVLAAAAAIEILVDFNLPDLPRGEPS